MKGATGQQPGADSYLAIFMIFRLFAGGRLLPFSLRSVSSVSYLGKDDLAVQIDDKTFRYYGLRSQVFTSIF